jgi:nucleoside 2-deoxyribosyltransferase
MQTGTARCFSRARGLSFPVLDFESLNRDSGTGAKMDKKYQVFISSTYTDMKAERQAAVEAILDAGHIPAGMELFAASDESQMEVIRGWIDESDIFMLILGGRYGSIEPESGKSYIQLEYEYAAAQGKPLFALYLTDKAINEKVKLIGTDAMERVDSKKLNDFRSVVQGKLCAPIDEVKDIHVKTPKSIHSLAAKRDLVGWVRASSITDVSPLIAQLAVLQDENARLKATAQTVKAEPSLLPGGASNFSESRLDVPLELHIECLNVNQYGMPDIGRSSWKGSYIAVFSMIAAKLLEEPADGEVQAYLDKVLREQLPAYERVNVQEADFQAMKMKFVTLGVLELKKIGKVLCWTLTDNGKALLMKLHEDA